MQVCVTEGIIASNCMKMKSRITELFDIQFPIVQAGMIWASGWELAAAVSNAGGLGIIGAGSMYPEQLKASIAKLREHSNKPFAVNVPLLYPSIEEHMEIITTMEVPIVFTSAGNPHTWTNKLKDSGATVVHVVSSTKFALKAQQAGCDAVVAEGFEAGGHNGREETTTLCLVPAVCDAVSIPVIAAGGIADGKSMFAAMALGAEGVQVGSRFAASTEASCHEEFKRMIINSQEGDTILTLKELTPVRLLKNPFYQKIEEAYRLGKPTEELKELLGRGRAKRGMYEGDLVEGELEIGQVSARIREVIPAADIVLSMIKEFEATSKKMMRFNSPNGS
jgi:enoyl-[acyl-carrier protein] reductase II